MNSGFSDFFRYNLWANLRLVDACSKLTDEQLDFTSTGVYGSIRKTLIHIFASEERDIRDFNATGELFAPVLDELSPFPGFDTLRRQAKYSSTELLRISESANLRQVLHLPENYEAEVIIVLMQAIQHGVDHRSQIATLLTLQGVEAPRMDVWGYNNDLKT